MEQQALGGCIVMNHLLKGLEMPIGQAPGVDVNDSRWRYGNIQLYK